MRSLPTSSCPSTSPVAMSSAAVIPIVRAMSPVLPLRQFVETVESRGLIALGQRRVIENGIDEIFHGAAQNHNCLADVKQLRRPLADHVYPQHLLGLTMKAYLQTSRGVAANLAARDLAIVRHTHFVGNVLIGELLFGFPDERDFGDGINAVRITGRVRDQLLAESSSRRDAPLLHRNGCQAGKSDYVADGVNVRLRGPIFAINFDAPARVGLYARGAKIQLVDITGTAHCVEQCVARQLFLALQPGYHRAFG